MSRITQKDVEEKAKNLAEYMVDQLGSKRYPSIGYSYGKCDLHEKSTEAKKGEIVRHLTSGTKREVYDYLCGMSDMLSMLESSEVVNKL